MNLVRLEKAGLYCEAGDFYIDPWQPVERAVITHAHSDHARTDSKQYWSSASSAAILKHRLGRDIALDEKTYGEKFRIGNAWVSFHPAGHILGSAQVRIEVNDRVWVMSGDYKRTPDASCEPFEVVPCDTFISEATFALPIYCWEKSEVTAKKIFDWWQSDLTRPSLLFCYALGKAQRVLAELRKFTDQPVYLHGAVGVPTEIYRRAGIEMLPTKPLYDAPEKHKFNGELIIAPPSAHRSPWMKRFKEPQTAFASGWMQVRGGRRRRGYEKGFVLSDHADWNELNATIHETGAKQIYLTHGRTDALARHLSEQSFDVRLFQTQYEDEADE